MKEPHSSILKFCEDETRTADFLQNQIAQGERFTVAEVFKAIVELCFEGQLECVDRGKRTERYRSVLVEKDIGGGVISDESFPV